jgi:hypothetical protein
MVMLAGRVTAFVRATPDAAPAKVMRCRPKVAGRMRSVRREPYASVTKVWVSGLPSKATFTVSADPYPVRVMGAGAAGTPRPGMVNLARTE